MEIYQVKKTKYLVDYIIIINVIIFIIGGLLTFYNGNNFLINLGAKINYKIADLQYYRLLTPMFLHADVFHLIFNSFALFSIGRSVEVVLKKKKFLIVYIISVVFGTIGSFIFSESISVGASGGIFGLVGALLYISFLTPSATKKMIQKDIFIIIALNLFLGFTNPRIDNAAHIFGFIGGFLTSFSLGYAINSTFKLYKKIAFACIISFLIAFFALIVPQYRTSENYYLYKGASLYYEGDFIKSKDTFEMALERYPHNKEFSDILKVINSILE